MNFVIQKHNNTEQKVKLPEGIKELMSDMTREVLREQPENIYAFIADYLDAMLCVREDAIVAEQALNRIVDFSLTISFLLHETGMSLEKAEKSAAIIQESFDIFLSQIKYNSNSKQTFSEKYVLKKLIEKIDLTEAEVSNAKKIVEISFKQYFQNKMEFQTKLRTLPKCVLNDRANKTLNLYRNSGPTKHDLDQAATKVQAAFRGYFTRKNIKKQKEKK